MTHPHSDHDAEEGQASLRLDDDVDVLADGEFEASPDDGLLDTIEIPEELDGPPKVRSEIHKGIPEQFQKTWQSLSRMGTTKGKMQLFEAYLLGDTPMTPAQMEAGCHVGAALPGYSSKASRQLAKCLLDQLGVRYFESDNPEEKEAIQWVASSIFLSVYAKRYQEKLNNYTQGAAEALGLDVSSMGHGYIRSMLKKYDPTREETSSFDTYCNQKFAFLIRDEARKLLGRGDSPNYPLRLSLSIPVRIDELDPDQRYDERNIQRNEPAILKGIDRKSLPHTPSIADGIEAREQQTRIQSVIRMLIKEPPATLILQEVEFLGHYWAAIQQDEGANNDALLAIGAKETIAEKMGVSPSRISQLESSVLAKIAEALVNDPTHFDDATLEAILPQASNSHKQPTSATPPIASPQPSKMHDGSAEPLTAEHEPQPNTWVARLKSPSQPTLDKEAAFKTLCRSPLDTPPTLANQLPAEEMTIKNRRTILKAMRSADPLLAAAMDYYATNHTNIEVSEINSFEAACKTRMRQHHGLDELMTNTVWSIILPVCARPERNQRSRGGTPNR